jgi:inorganic pyrophosphatase
MTHPFHDIPTGTRPPDRLNAYIEIPRGSRNKYELDKETGLLRLDRLLYSSVHYPGDYGFFPQTLAPDGDPLDVLVLTTEATFPGCLIQVRPVGVFIMEDQDGQDEKVLTVPLADPLRRGIRSLNDLPSHFLDEVQHFFDIYKELEGVRVRTAGWEDVHAAREIVMSCIEQYPGREETSEEEVSG